LCAEARGVFLKDDMDGSCDAACLWVVHTVRGCVNGIANHDATERFFIEFPTLFHRVSGTLAKTAHPKTRNMDASDTYDVERVRGIVVSNTAYVLVADSYCKLL
jgi:hypothetical protein